MKTKLFLGLLLTLLIIGCERQIPKDKQIFTDNQILEDLGKDKIIDNNSIDEYNLNETNDEHENKVV